VSLLEKIVAHVAERPIPKSYLYKMSLKAEGAGFYRKAMKRVGPPRVITLDAYAAPHRAVRELKSESRLPSRVRVQSSKYLKYYV
jgi:transposase-like protein